MKKINQIEKLSLKKAQKTINYSILVTVINLISFSSSISIFWNAATRGLS